MPRDNLHQRVFLGRSLNSCMLIGQLVLVHRAGIALYNYFFSLLGVTKVFIYEAMGDVSVDCHFISHFGHYFPDEALKAC